MSGSSELGSEVGFSASRRGGPRALRGLRRQRARRERTGTGGRRARVALRGCLPRTGRRGSAGCEPGGEVMIRWRIEDFMQGVRQQS